MKAIVTSKGQVTIPHAIRKKAHIDAGTKIDFEIKDETTLIVHLPPMSDITKLKGIVKHKRRKPVSLGEMKKAISECASKK